VDEKNRYGVAHSKGYQDEQRREVFRPSGAPGKGVCTARHENIYFLLVKFCPYIRCGDVRRLPEKRKFQKSFAGTQTDHTGAILYIHLVFIKFLSCNLRFFAFLWKIHEKSHFFLDST